MGWFGRNREASEKETPESEIGGETDEVSEERNPEDKLSGSDRNRDFRESLKVNPSKEDDGTRKLDTGNDNNDGDEPGPRERSLPEDLGGNER